MLAWVCCKFLSWAPPRNQQVINALSLDNWVGLWRILPPKPKDASSLVAGRATYKLSFVLEGMAQRAPKHHILKSSPTNRAPGRRVSYRGVRSSPTTLMSPG